MNIFAIAGLSVGISCIILSFLTLFFGKTKLHRLLLYFNLVVANWGIGLFFVGIADSEASAITAWKMAHAGGFFLAPLFHHMISLFCGSMRKKIIYFAYVHVLFLYIGVAIGAIFSKVRYVNGLYYNVSTPSYTLGLIIFHFLVILSFYDLFRFLKNTRGHKRLQTQYIIFGFMFGFVGGSSTFLPMLGIDLFYPYGSFGITLYALILTYAILRHRLMDIRLIFRRTIIYSLSTGLLAGFFVLLVLAMTGYVSGLTGHNYWRVNIVAALISAILFNPLKRNIQLIVDKVFYRTSYNYYSAIQKTGSDLVKLIKVRDIQRYILKMSLNTLKIRCAYLLSLEGNCFKGQCFGLPKGRMSDKNITQKIDADSALAGHLKVKKDFIIKDELQELVAQDKVDRITEELTALNGELAIPIFIENQLSFILVLGEKLSGDIYSDEDINLLSTISNQAAISLKNALLYGELEQRVEDRTAELSNANAKLKIEIKERERSEKELKQFSRKLEQSNKELEDFAKIVSHDLQEPLWKVKMFGDRLKAGYAETLGGKGKDYLKIIYNSITRMQLLINDLLVLSSVTTMAQPHIPIDLKKVIEEVMVDLEVRIKQVNGCIEVHDMPVIEADPIHMRQLFQNLISNALKYYSESRPPVIKISSRITDIDSRGLDTACSAKQLYAFIVEDNGIGFDNNYNDYIFGVFHRLHGLSKYGGTGMGLAICRKIAEHYGGNITAKSTEGLGATFIVNLPVKQTIED